MRGLPVELRLATVAFTADFQVDGRPAYLADYAVERGHDALASTTLFALRVHSSARSINAAEPVVPSPPPAGCSLGHNSVLFQLARRAPDPA
jgi:hypothetical protein